MENSFKPFLWMIKSKFDFNKRKSTFTQPTLAYKHSEDCFATSYFMASAKYNSCTFSCGGFVKSKMYETCTATIFGLKQFIHLATKEIHRTFFLPVTVKQCKEIQGGDLKNIYLNVNHDISNSMQLCVSFNITKTYFWSSIQCSVY